MIQTFTPNDILLAHSGEFQKEESQLLQINITESDVLSDFESTLELLENLIPQMVSEPSPLALKGIMDFVEKVQQNPFCKIVPKPLR